GSPTAPKWAALEGGPEPDEARGTLRRGARIHGVRRLSVLLDVHHGVQAEPRSVRRGVRHAPRSLDLQRPAHARPHPPAVRSDRLPALGGKDILGDRGGRHYHRGAAVPASYRLGPLAGL